MFCFVFGMSQKIVTVVGDDAIDVSTLKATNVILFINALGTKTIKEVSDVVEADFEFKPDYAPGNFLQ